MHKFKIQQLHNYIDYHQNRTINCLKQWELLIFSLESIEKWWSILRFQIISAINNCRATRNNSTISILFLSVIHNYVCWKFYIISRHFACKKNSFLFEQPPQCSAVTRSIPHRNLFIRYISNQSCYSGRGVRWNEDKQEIWWALTQLTLRCLKYIKRMFSLNVIWHSYFLIPRQSFCGKRAKSLEKFFLQLWKCNSFYVNEISRNRGANTNIHWRR